MFPIHSDCRMMNGNVIWMWTFVWNMEAAEVPMAMKMVGMMNMIKTSRHVNAIR